jgi:hypothetical protein
MTCQAHERGFQAASVFGSSTLDLVPNAQDCFLRS